MKYLFPSNWSSYLILRSLCVLVLAIACSCATAESKNSSANTSVNGPIIANASNSAAGSKGATIDIEPNGPADTVRAFYKNLREKKFREAIFLTNLRPAVEGLTDTELKDFAIDFEAIAGQVPAEIQINGEIITGDKATVTANLPNEDGDKTELQTIKLKKIDGIWIIQTADDEAEKQIRLEGKNYFYNLRIKTHEDEAKKMLERISKAQLAHSLQNGGLVADMATLIKAGLLPADVSSNESTGYDFAINVAADKKRYTATATPAVYGKSGKQSFLLQIDPKGISRVTGRDNGGKPLEK